MSALAKDLVISKDDDYDPSKVPVTRLNGAIRPVAVNLSFLLFNIFDFNEREQRLSLDLVVIKQWVDHRIRTSLPNGTDFWVLRRDLLESAEDMLWVPDIYVVQEFFNFLDFPLNFSIFWWFFFASGHQDYLSRPLRL